MTDRLLPDGLTPGRATPSFTDETVPNALRNAHHTTVWAELIVEQGNVLFVEEDPAWQILVTAGSSQPIVPNRKHHVEPEPEAVFRVQFYDGP
jgi:tellurite resistance-related uncharacterized protein